MHWSKRSNALRGARHCCRGASAQRCSTCSWAAAALGSCSTPEAYSLLQKVTSAKGRRASHIPLSESHGVQN